MTCHSFKGNLRSVCDNKDLNNKEKNVELYINCHKVHMFACALIVFPFEKPGASHWKKSHMRTSSDISDPQQCVASPSADWRFVRHLCGYRGGTAPMGCTAACLSPSQELYLHLCGLHTNTCEEQTPRGSWHTNCKILTAVSWLLMVNIALFTQKVHISVQHVSFQAMCV